MEVLPASAVMRSPPPAVPDLPRPPRPPRPPAGAAEDEPNVLLSAWATVRASPFSSV